MAHIERNDMNDIQAAVSDEIKSHWPIFFGVGFVVMLLGITAVILPYVSTLAVEILLGWLFFIAGVVRLFALISTQRMPGRYWALAAAVASAGLGLVLVYQPLVGVITLTMVLIALFIVEGAAAIFAAMDTRHHVDNWGWSLFHGVVSLVLAGLIWAGWPASAAWAIGLLAGCNMFFSGLVLVMLAIRARNLSHR